MDEVRQRAIAYGERYLGTLMPATTAEFPDMAAWAHTLTDVGRPVAWFDRNGESWTERPRSALFTRCYFDETSAIRLALEHLNELGHRRVGYSAVTDVDWRHARRRLLIDETRKMGGTVELLTSGCQSDFLRELAPQTLENLVDEVSRRSAVLKQLIRSAFANRANVESRFRNRGYVFSGRTPGEQLKTLFQFIEEYGTTEGVALLGLARAEIRALQLTPLLAHFLLAERVTAIIAASDVDARSFHGWFERFGLTLGEHVSLIGFDNYWLPDQIPVTTVDFGFGYLGIAAFHVLSGVENPPRDESGDIAARPHIAYRGSTGPAPTSDL